MWIVCSFTLLVCLFLILFWIHMSIVWSCVMSRICPGGHLLFLFGLFLLFSFHFFLLFLLFLMWALQGLIYNSKVYTSVRQKMKLAHNQQSHCMIIVTKHDFCHIWVGRRSETFGLGLVIGEGRGGGGGVEVVKVQGRGLPAKLQVYHCNSPTESDSLTISRPGFSASWTTEKVISSRDGFM